MQEHDYQRLETAIAAYEASLRSRLSKKRSKDITSYTQCRRVYLNGPTTYVLPDDMETEVALPYTVTLYWRRDLHRKLNLECEGWYAPHTKWSRYPGEQIAYHFEKDTDALQAKLAYG